MTQPLLTVAIPTFNRNELLKKNLSFLLRQLPATQGQVQVLVLDNASPVPVADTLGELPLRVELRRNAFNVGGNANILRCIELCQTPWLWILGDDDRPEDNVLDIFLSAISTYPDAHLINFAPKGEHSRAREWECQGLTSLLKSLDSFRNLLFTPSSLFRTDILQKNMNVAYYWEYSCAPHLAALFMGLNDTSRIVFSAASTVAYERPEVENRGAVFKIALGIPTLTEIPIAEKNKRLLTKHLASFPRLSSIIHQSLLRQVYAGESCSKSWKRYLAIMQRRKSLGPVKALAGAFLGLMLWAPNLSYKIVALLYKQITGQASGRNKVPDDRL